MATFTPVVPPARPKSPVRGFIKPGIDMIKSFFSPVTTPPPMSEKDIKRHLYPDHTGSIQCRLVDHE